MVQDVNNSKMVTNWNEFVRVTKILQTSISKVNSEDKAFNKIATDIQENIKKNLKNIADKSNVLVGSSFFDGDEDKQSLDDSVSIIYYLLSQSEQFASSYFLIESKPRSKGMLNQTVLRATEKDQKNYHLLTLAMNKFDSDYDQNAFILCRQKPAVNLSGLSSKNSKKNIFELDLSTENDKKVIKELSTKSYQSSKITIETLKFINWRSQIQLIHRLFENHY